MANKRVCIIRSNPVRPDSRVEKEAYTLKKAGFQVTILCWDRDDNHDATDEIVTVSDENIPIVRIGYQAAFGAGLKSILPFSRFQLSMIVWLWRHRSEFDIIHACDFDTAFCSLLVGFLCHKRFVFDIFDYLRSGSNSLTGRMIRMLQTFVINHADATIICTEERKAQLGHARPKKLAVIHNTPMSIQMTQQKKWSENKHAVSIAYVGVLQDHRLLKELGHFFSLHHEYEWHVGGFGKYENHFQKLSENHQNIKYYGRLKYEDTLQLEGKCDILLCIYDPKLGNHKYAAPNKFYESLMLGKPVIMTKGIGMSQVVADYEIGELIDYSEDGFSEGLDRLLRRKNAWPAISKKMVCLYREQYSWEEMSRRLIDLYQEL